MSPAAAAALVFAGKSVAAPVIKEIITKALSYLGGYLSAESMEEMRSKLDRGMPKIQAVLDVVSPDQIKDKSKALDDWFWQLRGAVEDAEDAIDELEYHELEKKANDQKISVWGSPFAKMKHKVVRSVKHASILDKTVKQFTHHGTIKKLMKAMEGLDKVAADIAGILAVTDHLNGVASSSQQQVQLVNYDRETGSTLSATTFVGREKEKEQIIGWLMKTSVESPEIVTSTSSVPIISVVGHGGMGKTTLAQSICEEDVVLKHFKVIWVTILLALMQHQ
jgi:signal recognition particle GTPase